MFNDIKLNKLLCINTMEYYESIYKNKLIYMN